jgi:hypothetical protein
VASWIQFSITLLVQIVIGGLGLRFQRQQLQISSPAADAGIQPTLRMNFWRYWPLGAMIILSVIAWIPFLLTAWPAPRLSATILAHTHGGTWVRNPNVSAVIILAEVANQGTAPSAAKTWRLAVEIDGTKHYGIPEYGDSSPQMLNNDHLYTFDNADYLPNKTLSPIPPGGIVRGFLQFTFSDVDVGKIAVPRFILQFSDINDTAHEAITNPLAARSDIPMVFPGINTTVR